MIPDHIAAGPHPNPHPNKTQKLNINEPQLHPKMKWMIDFDEAEKKGMGLRLKLNVDEAQRGFDILMVVGTNTKQTAVDSQQSIADLLDAHHYTDGLGFVLNGTPSNNTNDAPAGYSTTDLAQSASYTSERASAAFKPGDRSNADVFSIAFGLRDLNMQAVANLAN